MGTVSLSVKHCIVKCRLFRYLLNAVKCGQGAFCYLLNKQHNKEYFVTCVSYLMSLEMTLFEEGEAAALHRAVILLR